jgi:hypothetical protein
MWLSCWTTKESVIFSALTILNFLHSYTLYFFTYLITKIGPPKLNYALIYYYYISNTILPTAEPFVAEPSSFKFQISVEKLKKTDINKMSTKLSHAGGNK